MQALGDVNVLIETRLRLEILSGLCGKEHRESGAHLTQKFESHISHTGVLDLNSVRASLTPLLNIQIQTLGESVSQLG